MTSSAPPLLRRALRPVACAALAFASACAHEPAETMETTAAVPVLVAEARVDTLEGVIAATGLVTVAPGAALTIVAPAPGRLAEVVGGEGDPVRAGQVLVRFDIPTLQADVDARRAAVAQATARADAARANFTRLSGLLAQGVAAPRDVEDATRAQAEANADVAQAASALAAATALADRGVVRAPFAGVVARRFHNAGDIVDAAASDPILEIIDPTRQQVTATVPVSELTRVVVGHAATVQPPGRPAEEAAAAVVLAKAPRVTPGSATADVRLAFRRPTTLAAGTAVRVDIVAEEHRGAIVIPAAAVVTGDDAPFVMIAGADGKARRSPVVVGLVSNGRVEITRGVKAGDRVIVRGQDGLPDGAAVTIEAS